MKCDDAAETVWIFNRNGNEFNISTKSIRELPASNLFQTAHCSRSSGSYVGWSERQKRNIETDTHASSNWFSFSLASTQWTRTSDQPSSVSSINLWSPPPPPNTCPSRQTLCIFPRFLRRNEKPQTRFSSSNSAHRRPKTANDRWPH